MSDSFSYISVLWLGIGTAISPCLLAANIAAIAYLGRSQHVWFAGLLYALGQVLAFWGLTVLVLGIPLFSGEQVSRFLALTLHALLGPLLIVIGMLLAGLIRFSLPSWDGDMMQKVTDRFGKWSALLLGMMFALAFCPTTGGFFLGLLTLTAERMAAAESLSSGKIVPLMVMPALFGLGTSLPILVFSGILATQRELLDRTFQSITGIERPARWITGGVFILVGLWLTIQRFAG